MTAGIFFLSFFYTCLDFSREHQVISSIEPKITKIKSNYTNLIAIFWLLMYDSADVILEF